MSRVRAFVYSASVIGVGYVLLQTIVPNEEQILNSLSPQLKIEYLRNKQKRIEDERRMLETIKENAHSDRPIWQIQPAMAVPDDQENEKSKQ
ncbi:assembly factor cbp4 [Spiromyces aspiralis]|uniref:Assembly factor cbp4 n=1 Tax=Spiromyces aspiralis TaxID=68401 RepID=A0ACC1HNG1_9FUNG|nr:assembly factor cbp4 [Spiromyces aspiralis]